MEEKWLPCNDIDISDYEVSNLGRIRNPKTGRILKTQINHKGYEVISIHGKSKYVHKIVASTFIKNRSRINNSSIDIIHKNGDRLKNYSDNLDYTTHSENIRRTYLNGRRQKHRMRPVRCVDTGEEFESIESCAKATGLNKHSICRNINGCTKCMSDGRRFEPID